MGSGGGGGGRGGGAGVGAALAGASAGARISVGSVSGLPKGSTAYLGPQMKNGDRTIFVSQRVGGRQSSHEVGTVSPKGKLKPLASTGPTRGIHMPGTNISATAGHDYGAEGRAVLAALKKK
jgi:hypothetical protein